MRERFEVVRFLKYLQAVILPVLLFVLMASAAWGGGWSDAGSMATGRTGHTATLLPNGKVLAVGGRSYSGDSIASAELYDSATNTWSPAGTLTTARYSHTATLLSNGKVLVVGGHYYNKNSYINSYIATAELYDPDTNSWSTAGSLTTARDSHTATLLPNGKVLVAGGTSNSIFLPLNCTIRQQIAGVQLAQ